MKTKEEIAEQQAHIQSKIQSEGFNIVTCGNCGTVLLHEIKPITFEKVDEDGEDVNNLIDCFCGLTMSLTDCPDLNY